jgi:hypothetical protein
MRRITWIEAESVHRECGPMWDATGLQAQAVFLLDDSLARLLVICRRDGLAQTLTYDPLVGLWVSSYLVDDLGCAELSGLQWFREIWTDVATPQHAYRHHTKRQVRRLTRRNEEERL